MKTVFNTLLVAGIIAGSAFGGELEQKAISIAKDKSGAIVEVTGKITSAASGMGVMLGGNSEQSTRAVGTVIDSSGLTVVSISAINPMSLLEGISIAAMHDGSDDIKINSNLSGLKIVLPNGDEYPAKMIMKDPDLDLGFIMPDKDKVGKHKFDFIKLDDSSETKLLSKVISVSRLGKNLHREIEIRLSRVTAVIKKPRTLYALEIPIESGAPVFTAEGKLLGIAAMRKNNGPKSNSMMMKVKSRQVVVPADDMVDTAKQALKKTESKKD